MVSSQISGLTKTNVQKTFKKQVLLPMGPPDVVPSEHVEFDFSDVFGPAPTHTSVEAKMVIPEGSLPAASDDKVYSEPVVILTRSHSLVGPTARICQSPRIRKHILHETELELVECPSGAEGEQEKPSPCYAEEHEVISQSNRVESVGPAPTHTSVKVNMVIPEGSLSAASDDRVYSEPVIILTRSHSLVGPTARICQSPRIRKHILHETELELVECPSGADGEQKKPSPCDAEEHEVISQSNRVESVGLEDFDFLKVVGQGAFGKVFQVMKKGTSEIYAMKVVRKDKIIEKNHSEYMKAERDILTKIDHPFIVQLRYSFQTKYRLYLVLDFVNGGHLFFQLYHHGLFREDLARIYTAEIVCAVSHLHANGIMHRDLKPENILLDADGHVMLTDFGLAKQFEENARSNSMCGTVEYMAPEIILGKGHDKAADWWSIGVLLFEMLTGKPPFIGGNRDKIQQKIVKDKIKLPAYLSSEAHSLLKGLLQKEASKRLGSGPGGSNEIKSHKWFKSINWRKLEAREIQPSFRPNVAGKICVANFEERWTSMPLTVSPVASPVAGSSNFSGFSYVKPPTFLQKPSPLS